MLIEAITDLFQILRGAKIVNLIRKCCVRTPERSGKAVPSTFACWSRSFERCKDSLKMGRMDEKTLMLFILALTIVSMIAVRSSEPSKAYGSSVASIENEEARGKIAEAYKAVAEAEEKGGDVSSLLVELNSIIDLVREAESKKDEAKMSEASARLDEVIEKASEIGDLGLAAAQRRQNATTLALGAELSVALIAYIYAPRAFWRIWIKVKGRWRVKAVEER